jgi:hypothetical protein
VEVWNHISHFLHGVFQLLGCFWIITTLLAVMFIVTGKYTDRVMALAIHAVKRLDENEKKGFVLGSVFVLCFGGSETEPYFLQVIPVVFQLLCILLNDKKT